MGIDKTCKKCHQTKSISYFYKQKKGLLGRTAECKECRRKRSKIYADQNKERKSAVSKLRYKFTDRRAYNAKWRKENPDYFKEYYKQNTEIRLACNRRFWKKHPERYKAYRIYQVARNKGVLINPNQCQMCGTKDLKIQGHHFDYTKPLAVTWVCTECHKDIHRKKRFTSS